jgi:hypothetical protein
LDAQSATLFIEHRVSLENRMRWPDTSALLTDERGIDAPTTGMMRRVFLAHRAGATGIAMHLQTASSRLVNCHASGADSSLSNDGAARRSTFSQTVITERLGLPSRAAVVTQHCRFWCYLEATKVGQPMAAVRFPALLAVMRFGVRSLALLDPTAVTIGRVMLAFAEKLRA